MIITFSGPSGSGKTMLINHILKSSYFSDKKIQIIEEDSFVILKIVKKIIGNNEFKKFNDKNLYQQTANDHKSRFFRTISIWIYPFIMTSEYLVRYLINMINNKKVVIFDRYSYDYFVTYKHNFRTNNSFLNKIILSSPKPDISFVLMITDEMAISRNKNNYKGAITNNKSFHSRVIDEYNNLAKKRNLIQIDSTKTLLKTSAKVIGILRSREILLAIRSIALCGSDGTGKSTISKMLADYLISFGIKVVAIHYFHDNILFKFLKKVGIIQKKSEEEEVRINYEKSQKKRLKLEKSFIWALLHFSDSLIQYFFYRIFYWNRLIIHDRYFYDFIVSFQYHRIKGTEFFIRFIPKIKNVFVFQDTPKNIFTRKPENVYAFFIEIDRLYSKLSKEFNLNNIRITNKSPQKVFNELISRIEL